MRRGLARFFPPPPSRWLPPRGASWAWVRDNPRGDNRPVQAPLRRKRSTRQIRLPHTRCEWQAGSWPPGKRLRSDRRIALVENRDVVADQELVDLGLVFRDELVERAFPFLVRWTNRHTDSKDHLRTVGFLHQRRDDQRRIHPACEIARHRAPQDAAVDIALIEVVDHGLRR